MTAKELKAARQSLGFTQQGLADVLQVSRVTVVDPSEKHLEVVVDDSQLSLAIGKKGQNVRLAAKLLGWKIDIKSEEEKRQEVEQQMATLVGQSATPLEKVPDLGEGLIQKLSEAGITTVEALADMTPEQLEELPGVGPKTMEKISIAVNNYFSSLDQAATPAEGAPEVQAAELPEDAAATGQALEAAAIAGVENAPPADVAEVHTHGEASQPGAPKLQPEEIVEPEIPQPEEQAEEDK